MSFDTFIYYNMKVLVLYAYLSSQRQRLCVLKKMKYIYRPYNLGRSYVQPDSSYIMLSKHMIHNKLVVSNTGKYGTSMLDILLKLMLKFSFPGTEFVIAY